LINGWQVVAELEHVLVSWREGGGRLASDTKNDWGAYGRKPIGLLALAAFIDAVDRQTLPGVLPLIQDDLGFSDFQFGVLGSIFVLAGVLATLPAGYMADRFRRTHLLATVLIIWSVISALNAGVQTFAQFLAIRAVLGLGETLGGPSAGSLIADYYPATLRGRAYSYRQVAPIFGLAVGLGLSGAVGALLGWRVAFLLVGPPGIVLTWWLWRMKEPQRGESDERAPAEAGVLHAAARQGFRALLPEIKTAALVPSLRTLIIGSAISTGATAGFGFWAPTFYERHTSVSVGAAGTVVGGVIAIGAVIGILTGGRITDRLRQSNPGAPMLMAGVCQTAAACIFLVTFIPVPLWIRIPGQMAGVAFLLAAVPALLSMISQVVPAEIRGISFALNTFLGSLVAAGSPLLIGWLGERFPLLVAGETVGNLQIAFALVTPLIITGALVVFYGRRFVADDIKRVEVRA
jgi:MFS family permease